LKRLVSLRRHTADTVESYNLAHRLDRYAIHQMNSAEATATVHGAEVWLSREAELVTALQGLPERLTPERLRRELAGFVPQGPTSTQAMVNRQLLKRLGNFIPPSLAESSAPLSCFVFPEAPWRTLRPDIAESLELLSAMQDRDCLIEAETLLSTVATAPIFHGLPTFLAQRRGLSGASFNVDQDHDSFCRTLAEAPGTAIRVSLPLNPAGGVPPSAIANQLVNSLDHFYFSGHDRYYQIPRPEETAIASVSMPYWLRYHARVTPGAGTSAPFLMRVSDLLSFFMKESVDPAPEIPARETRITAPPSNGPATGSCITGIMR